MKIKLILCGASLLICYHLLASINLYRSSFLNVASYYTHPPLHGNIEFERLPMFFGDTLAKIILQSKVGEAQELVDSGGVSMAAILVSYRDELVLPIDEAQRRTFFIAELFIDAGYDIKLCEIDGKSTVANLERWAEFDKLTEEFLLQFIHKGAFYSCEYRD
jgi:hypothetical protein